MTFIPMQTEDIVFGVVFSFGIVVCWGLVIAVMSSFDRFCRFEGRYNPAILVAAAGFGVFPLINTLLAIVIVVMAARHWWKGRAG